MVGNVQDSSLITENDTLQRYCRKLGHYVHFRYCRTEHNDLPCSAVFDCWFEKIPVQEFIQKHYSKEEIMYLANPPEFKIVSLFKKIKNAKERTSRQ